MIISDRLGFIFVHIPKCAGTSVRRVLQRYHDGDPRFLECVAEHPVHGQIDFTHLPLALLAEIAPDVFSRLDRHATFAVVRDPIQRFQSAMAQRAKMYLGQEIAQMRGAEISAEIERVIQYLDSVDMVSAPEFIHFSRQSDFICFDGKKMVGNVFPVERLDLLARAISRHIPGDDISFGHANKMTVLRYPQLRSAARTGSRLAKSLMPRAVHEKIRGSARRMLLKPKDSSLLPEFDQPTVRSFISSFYNADFDLYRKARGRT